MTLENFKEFLLKKYLTINFLYFLIIFCSFKFFGYAIGFVFLIPFILDNKEAIVKKIKSLDTQSLLVISYFGYLIIQSFLGAINIRDFRVIIYWVTFFTVSISIYIIHNYKYDYDSNYRINFQEILFKSSSIYFVVFFIINFLSFVFFGNEYDIQSDFWVGGSTSFNISSIFLYILFYKWSEISFKINCWFTLNIVFYTFLILLNNSRLGQIYLLLFLFFTFLKSFKINNLINGCLIISLCLFTYSIGHSAIHNFISLINNNDIKYRITPPIKDTKNNIKNILAIPNDISNNKRTSYDSNRIIELKIGLEKFKSSKIKEKLFGTGWYSSRLTINNIRNQMIEKLNLEKYFIKTEIAQLQGIVSILLDTGLIGLIFMITLFILNIKNIIIFNSNSLNKSFYICLICTNFFCLFIGYPWINIPFLLMLLPNGIFFLEEYK